MKITIPTSWSEVSVKQYIDLCNVPSLGFSDEDAILKELEVLTGISDEVYYNLDYVELKKIISKIAFTRTKYETKGVKNNITLNGNKFAINLNPKELTSGEYIDLQTYIKDGVNKNLHKIIAIYLKPIKLFGLKKECYKKNVYGQYVQTIESRRETEKLILEHMKMDAAFNLSSFFLKLHQSLTVATQHYLAMEVLKQKLKISKQLAKEVS